MKKSAGVIIGWKGPGIAGWNLMRSCGANGLSDTEQKERLIESGVLYNPDWKEVILLFAGVLCKQGFGKMTGFKT